MCTFRYLSSSVTRRRPRIALGLAGSWISLGAFAWSTDFCDKEILSNTAIGVRDVHAADIDGDGDADVVSASNGGDTIFWIESLGGAAFSPPKVISIEADGPAEIDVADLDGDGDNDVLSTSYDGRIAWYPNLGGGSFGGQKVLSTHTFGPGPTRSTDLDGDGDVDVLFSVPFGRLSWHENLGAGTFSVEKVLDTSLAFYRVDTGDLDGDGDQDIICAGTFPGGAPAIGWLENLGAGTFGAATLFSYESVLSALAAVDLDGDGDLDVLAASAEQGTLTWHENLGGWLLGPPIPISASAGDVEDVDLADLDHDGDLDILIASSHDDKVAWYENLGGGAFGSEKGITTGADGVVEVHAGDLDGDGDVDILSASPLDDTVAWYQNWLGAGSCPHHPGIPTLLDLVPSVIPALNAGQTPVTIHGEELCGATEVIFGDQTLLPGAFTVVDCETITCVPPVPSSTMVDVRVTTWVASNPLELSYAPTDPPALNLSPGIASNGSQIDLEWGGDPLDQAFLAVNLDNATVSFGGSLLLDPVMLLPLPDLNPVLGVGALDAVIAGVPPITFLYAQVWMLDPGATSTASLKATDIESLLVLQ